MKVYYQKTKNPDPLGYVTEGGRERGRTARWLYRMRKRAKDKGVEFNLDATDLVVPPVCPVLGMPLAFSTDRHDPHQPSVDRINPSKGYTKDNIVVVSLRANLLKQTIDGTSRAELLEMRRVLDFYLARSVESDT